MRHGRSFVAAAVLGTTILDSTPFEGAPAFGLTNPTSRAGGVVNVFAESNGSKPGR